MPFKILLKSVGFWLLILLCAFINGALREIVFMRHVDKPAAFVLSGLLLSVCILIVAVLFVRRHVSLSTIQSLGVGLLWLALTLLFEFGFGRFVQNRTWHELLDAYTFKDGNIWPLVLIVTLIAPFIAIRLRK